MRKGTALPANVKLNPTAEKKLLEPGKLKTYKKLTIQMFSFNKIYIANFSNLAPMNIPRF